ncbi:MAG TPA: ABC transporter ATP-binding protein [Pseudothermotoga sp.]|uniref:energy-coupling factor ABC transporter ATP-binding protein n=1 Tax=Thermotoga profunda TaxID=1508420 RepID=UPI000693B55A|nr:ABC transporter ATP-binding protein [Thermotoga profunda]
MDSFQIQLQDMSFSYDNSKLILRRINMIIKPEDFILIVGENGAGKSTLLKIIAGVLKPRSGCVLVNGRPIHKDKEYFKKIGFVMQYAEDSFCCDTVFDEISFASKNFKLDRIKERVENAARLVGVDQSLFSKSPYELSSGEARKVAIASMLAHDPFLLILDEPFVGLDKLGKESLRNILINWKKQGKSTVIVSHQTKYVDGLANKVFKLEAGSFSQINPF